MWGTTTVDIYIYHSNCKVVVLRGFITNINIILCGISSIIDFFIVKCSEYQVRYFM